MFIADDVENGSLGPFAERPRTFPNMRSKAHTPLVNTIQCKTLFMGFNPYFYMFIFVCIGLVVAKIMCFSWGVRFMYAFDS